MSKFNQKILAIKYIKYGFIKNTSLNIHVINNMTSITSITHLSLTEVEAFFPLSAACGLDTHYS